MGEHNLTEAAFFGKITAGVTHELKNVLAVIKETSGLMGDILAVTKEETFQHKEKFKKALATIQRQIAHGADLLTHLNKFSHGPEKETAEIDINGAVNELVALCGRFARMKNVTLTSINSEETITFTTCQISLQMLLFTCFEYCMSHLPPSTKIDIKVEKNCKDDECLVMFECSHELSGTDNSPEENSSSNSLEKMDKIAISINGKVSASPSSIKIILSSQQ